MKKGDIFQPHPDSTAPALPKSVYAQQKAKAKKVDADRSTLQTNNFFSSEFTQSAIVSDQSRSRQKHQTTNVALGSKFTKSIKMRPQLESGSGTL